MTENLRYYMEIDYPIILKRIPDDAGGGWYAEHPDLKGCIADGSTKEESLENLEFSKELWIETALKRKIQIPLPAKEIDDFSGKLTLRMPKYLHRDLSIQAKEQEISLNQYILSLISFNAGQQELLKLIEKSIKESAPTININMDVTKKQRRPSKTLEDVMNEQWSGKTSDFFGQREFINTIRGVKNYE